LNYKFAEQTYAWSFKIVLQYPFIQWHAKKQGTEQKTDIFVIIAEMINGE